MAKGQKTIYKNGRVIKNLTLCRFCKVLFSDRFKILNGIFDASIQRNCHFFHNLPIIVLHTPSDPVQHDADKTVFVKFRDKLLIFFLQLQSGAFFLNHISDQLIGQLV